MDIIRKNPEALQPAAESREVALPGKPLNREDREKARSIIDQGTPTATKKAHEDDLRFFWTWARAFYGEHVRESYPVSKGMVVAFVTQCLTGIDRKVVSRMEEIREAEVLEEEQDPDSRKKHQMRRRIRIKRRHAVSTVSRRIATLSWAHNVQEFENPCARKQVKYLLSQARRGAVKAGWKPRRKDALVLPLLEQLLETCQGAEPINVRDRAILLFGFAAGGRRRSEIAGAKLEHLTEVSRGFIYTIPHSKTDQTGEGHDVAVFGEAAEALKAWVDELAKAGICEGQVFRRISRWGSISKAALSGKGVEHLMKQRLLQAGIDPEKFSPHSLRAGFLTQAADDGVALSEAMQMSAHKSYDVASRYYRKSDAAKNQAADLIGKNRGDATLPLDLAVAIRTARPRWGRRKRERFLKERRQRIATAMERELLVIVMDLADQWKSQDIEV